jgi:predicted Rossmann fold flavoprotein
MNNLHIDVIVIGAGAAGLMSAIEAGKRGRKVLVLEHNERIGKKILISGGGRCNFTNLHTKAENYISSHPDFCKSALSRYTPRQFIELVEKHHIPYHEKKLGQLFCDQSSRQIVDLLEKECHESNVEIELNCKIKTIRKNTSFVIETEKAVYEASSVVIATGGLSFPKLGATHLGYRVAKQFGLNITELSPGLVPFEFNNLADFASLSGISIDAIVTFKKQSFRENLLFTHRGLSGPAILQISSYWKPGEYIEIDLLPGVKETHLFSEENKFKNLNQILSEFLPKRFVQYFCKNSPTKPIHNYSKKDLAATVESLRRWRLLPSGTEGYAKAEVTLGGIHTSELSSKTMESRSVSGLFFIGEVVDVTGWLGGYNFQWAWASGHAAGEVA